MGQKLGKRQSTLCKINKQNMYSIIVLDSASIVKYPKGYKKNFLDFLIIIFILTGCETI